MISQVASKHDPLDCQEAREAIQLRHDDEPSRIDDRALDNHLQGCATCSTYRRDLESLRDLLQTVPAPPFPDEARQAILAGTVDRPTRLSPFLLARQLGFNLAAAAAIILAVIGAWYSTRPLDQMPEYTEAQLVQLENDLQEVMLALSGTLARSERLAIHDVLIDKASPALQIVPLRRDAAEH